MSSCCGESVTTLAIPLPAVGGLGAWVLCELVAVWIGEAHQCFFVVDELIARVVGDSVLPSIHTDCIARAGFDTVSAEDAAQLIDHELNGIALVATA